MTVCLYTRQGCHLCEQVAQLLERLRAETPFALISLDIDSDPALRRRYDWAVPVVVVDQRYRLMGTIDEAMLRDALTRAQRLRRAD